MRRGARPRIGFRGLDKARPHRVFSHIAHHHHQMIAAERTTVETILSQMADCRPLGLELLRVSRVGAPEGFGQRIFRVGRNNPIHGVGHECLAGHADAAIPRVALNQIEVDASVLVRLEDDRAPVASPGHMVRAVGDHNPAIPGHLSHKYQRRPDVLNTSKTADCHLFQGGLDQQAARDRSQYSVNSQRRCLKVVDTHRLLRRGEHPRNVYPLRLISVDLYLPFYTEFAFSDFEYLYRVRSMLDGNIIKLIVCPGIEHARKPGRVPPHRTIDVVLHLLKVSTFSFFKISRTHAHRQDCSSQRHC